MTGHGETKMVILPRTLGAGLLVLTRGRSYDDDDDDDDDDRQVSADWADS